ncbi:MAG: undecaprenyldiphospho-muramoylpentapeptide beta-N-acetylglucosaminyltransferase [Oscillospiraceae bacterium]|jgi:UDP-N-acetylglucosamine--N-acetylmuramyl-(pentapeptide) pyrophosphoryl-undecaprenol N-acetylglucosamine transferase|nr:undecaprenyldiphospho-muramoylpentapeptide beta-N-acetylglucosaminyltransferase [Oscillospiraceae bacterium]
MFDNKRILFAAGGTAGHINPALSVAGLLRYLHPEIKILFVGTADRMEAKLVPQAGFALRTIEISGFQRSLSPENIKRNLGTVKKLIRVSGQVNQILDEFQPDLALGFGGYVSGPVLRAAGRRGIPTAIHEQNAYPGITNKALARRADAVMLTDMAAAQRMKCKNPPVHTGLPIRRELLAANPAARRELGLDERPMVLSMGGSLGARAINEAVCGMIALLWKERAVQFHHAYGQYGAWVPGLLQQKGVDLNAPELTLREYIDDMARCLSAADLVIGRGGASAVNEIQALGKPSILIPSPNVAENHQYFNAKTLADRGAAILIEEKDLTPALLADTVRMLLADKARLADMGKAARAMAVTDANERIYDVLRGLAGK